MEDVLIHKEPNHGRTCPTGCMDKNAYEAGCIALYSPGSHLEAERIGVDGHFAVILRVPTSTSDCDPGSDVYLCVMVRFQLSQDTHSILTVVQMTTTFSASDGIPMLVFPQKDRRGSIKTTNASSNNPRQALLTEIADLRQGVSIDQPAWEEKSRVYPSQVRGIPYRFLHNTRPSNRAFKLNDPTFHHLMCEAAFANIIRLNRAV